jgi:hypothetical protein
MEGSHEFRRGRGTIRVVKTTEEGAREILARIQSKDHSDSGLSYEARYAFRVDAAKVIKQLTTVDVPSPTAANTEV